MNAPLGRTPEKARYEARIGFTLGKSRPHWSVVKVGPPDEIVGRASTQEAAETLAKHMNERASRASHTERTTAKGGRE